MNLLQELNKKDEVVNECLVEEELEINFQQHERITAGQKKKICNMKTAGHIKFNFQLEVYDISKQSVSQFCFPWDTQGKPSFRAKVGTIEVLEFYFTMF